MGAVIYILDHKGIMTQSEWSKAEFKRHNKGRIRNSEQKVKGSDMPKVIGRFGSEHQGEYCVFQVEKCGGRTGYEEDERV